MSSQLEVFAMIRYRVRRGVKLFFRVGVHLFIICAGLWGLVLPPNSVTSATSWTIRILWAGLLIVGGVLCVIGLRRSTYGPQVLGLALTSGGILTYAAAVSGGLPNGGVAMFLFLAFADQQISRLVQLRQLARARVDGGRGFWRPLVVTHVVHPDPHPDDHRGGVVRSPEGEGTGDGVAQRTQEHTAHTEPDGPS